MVQSIKRSESSQVSVITRKRTSAQVQIPVTDYKSVLVPGTDHTKLGVAYVNVLDIPAIFDRFMKVNPRVPNRTKAGILSGPVTKGILSTLRDNPGEMVLKNQGIYLLTDSAKQSHEGNKEFLTVNLTDPKKHGIVNGGHTYAAIREAIELASEEELANLKKAFVQLHVLQGVEADMVPEIAEGLNRSKQVDNPSLANLQGEFDSIRKVLKGTKGENAVAYSQGDNAPVYITEVLSILEMFNVRRFTDKKQPHALYSKAALGLKMFVQDAEEDKSMSDALIQKLPEFLELADCIRKLTPRAAKHNSFQFGRVKLGAERAGGKSSKGMMLPFIGEEIEYKIPNGWLYPMLAAFRANLKETDNGKALQWIVPIKEVLPEVIDDLVGVCVSEHKYNNTRPELIGKREAAYAQCYTKVELYLAKKKKFD